jgi:hypothetical protein
MPPLEKSLGAPYHMVSTNIAIFFISHLFKFYSVKINSLDYGDSREWPNGFPVETLLAI